MSASYKLSRKPSIDDLNRGTKLSYIEEKSYEESHNDVKSHAAEGANSSDKKDRGMSSSIFIIQSSNGVESAFRLAAHMSGTLNPDHL